MSEKQVSHGCVIMMMRLFFSTDVNGAESADPDALACKHAHDARARYQSSRPCQTIPKAHHVAQEVSPSITVLTPLSENSH